MVRNLGGKPPERKKDHQIMKTTTFSALAAGLVLALSSCSSDSDVKTTQTEAVADDAQTVSLVVSGMT